MTVLLRLSAFFLFVVTLMLPQSQLFAQTYPTRAVTVICPFAAGGSADTIMRLIGQHLTEKWKQPVVVENKVGIGGNVGTDAVAKSAPDGYTLLIVPSSIAIAPHLYTKLAFDPIKDFAPITLIGNIPMVLVVHPDFPAKSVAELIKLAKEKPGDIAYASAGNGSTNHLATEMFMAQNGIKLLHVPYRANPQAIIDVIGGRVPVFFDFVLTGAPHVRENKVRALATTGPKRSPVLPDVPTVVEQGINFEAGTWFGIYAPAGTPRPIIEKVNADVLAVLAIPAVKERLAALGVEIYAKGPADLAALTKADLDRWGPIVKQVGIKLD
jgi:tripartite-type tricarboxylate transporter receptor subunit TctC